MQTGAADNTTSRFATAAALFFSILAAQIIILRLMGRVWICACGTVKLWENEIYSAGNSQHIADWYTPTHVSHGFLFYGLFWLLLRRKSLGLRLGLATLLEVGWEILENSPLIIERYRAETISLDYFGDSILNSGMDTVFMAIGFLLAANLPTRLSFAYVIISELLLAWLIRDNLTLNILMLVYPMDAVKQWQGAGHVAWLHHSYFAANAFSIAGIRPFSILSGSKGPIFLKTITPLESTR